MKCIYNEFYINDKQTIKLLTTHDSSQYRGYINIGLIHEGFKIKNIDNE